MQGTRSTGHRGGYSKSYAFRGAARQLTDSSPGLEQSCVSCPLEKADLPARTATRAHPFDLSCCRFGLMYHLTSKLSGPAPPASPMIIPEAHSGQYPEAGRAIAAASAGGVTRAAPPRQFRAGWPQGIAPLGLPQIRTCTFAHTAPHIMSSLRDGSLN